MTFVYQASSNRDARIAASKMVREKLHPSHLEKAARFHRWQDCENTLWGRMLLLNGLADLGIPLSMLPAFELNAFGKPQPIQGVHFNISHAAERVVCALTRKMEVGIDVEFVDRNVDIEDFRGVFSKAEWQWIDHDREKFFTLWTQKESVMKAMGKGFSQNPTDIAVSANQAMVNGRTFWLAPVPTQPRHIAYVCRAQPWTDGEVVIKEYT